MTQTTQPTVIIGGNGKTGSRVAARLQNLGRPVRLASRSTPFAFDWNDEPTWSRAFEGAGSLYLTYHPDLSVPGAAEHVGRLSRLAARSGTERIVLLSARGEPQVKLAEQAVQGSGVPTTILKCAFFCQNFSEGLLTPVDGAVHFPAGNVAEPFVDCDDIADVAVAALTEDGHAGQVYELTGPRALSFAEAARAMALAARRPIQYVPVSFEQYAQGLAGQLPPAQIEFFIELFRFLLDGHNAFTTGDVERVLRRPATRFEDFATKAAPAWRG